MKKLLYKTAFFVFPFFLLYLFSFKYYRLDKGDLIRLGYIPNIYNYDFRKLFAEDFKKNYNCTNFSEINLKKKNKFSVFTIGDSFSEQGSVGYQNYLEYNSDIEVLHLDGFLHDNPIETVNGFLNGNVLDSIKVDYIILQSVERSIVNRGIDFNKKSKINIDSLTNLINKHKEKLNKHKEKLHEEVLKEKTKDKFFCRETLKFPLNAIYYNFDDNAYSSKTYQVKTKQNLFSTNNHKLLFLDDDYEVLSVNNNLSFVKTLNSELNMLAKRLKERGIKLIVLPSPDKLDFYYDDIINQNQYPKPLFFETMRSLHKNYIYVDSKKILKENTSNIKDVYFYDDTHWSPVASKIIADKIKSEIENSENSTNAQQTFGKKAVSVLK